MANVRSVFYNAGEDKNQFALVVGGEGNYLDLAALDGNNGVWQVYRAVPHAEEADYGDEGGGVSWHEQAVS